MLTRLEILETIEQWPLVNRNKVEDAKIEPLLETMKSSENERIGSLASQVLAALNDHIAVFIYFSRYYCNGPL